MRPGLAADYSPPSSAAVMEDYSYTSTYPLGHIGPVAGSIYLYLYIHTLVNTMYSKRVVTCGRVSLKPD